MSVYVPDEASDEEVARQAALSRPLAQSIRALIDAAIRTEASDEDIRQAQAEIEAATERLRRSQTNGPYGIRMNSTGRIRQWGNAVVGLRNAVAPPVAFHDDSAGRAWAEFHLGAAYEGPHGLVHGGVAALILDHLLGHAAKSGGRPGYTAQLTLRYLRGTPLGDLSAEAQIDRIDGRKTYVVGSLFDAEGITVEAAGLFILPRSMQPTNGAARPAALTDAGG
jgi:acyl-coenzyme A thioesterase PaaI-like protein